MVVTQCKNLQKLGEKDDFSSENAHNSDDSAQGLTRKSFDPKDDKKIAFSSEKFISVSMSLKFVISIYFGFVFFSLFCNIFLQLQQLRVKVLLKRKLLQQQL